VNGIALGRVLQLRMFAWIKKSKMVLLIPAIFLIMAALYVVGRKYSDNIEENRIQSILRESKTSEAPEIGYEITYAISGTVIVAYIPPRNANLPSDFPKMGTIEEQAKDAIENHAKQVGIKLPKNFQQDILITPMMQN
jgi:uncharacterized membrane protein